MKAEKQREEDRASSDHELHELFGWQFAKTLEASSSKL